MKTRAKSGFETPPWAALISYWRRCVGAALIAVLTGCTTATIIGPDPDDDSEPPPEEVTDGGIVPGIDLYIVN